MYSKYLDQNINERTFIIGDPQFGSPMVFKHVKARSMFGTMGKFHKSLIKNWNSAVSKDDTVLCLGDFAQNEKSRAKSLALIEHYSKQLNGKKILIRGNHDVENTQFYYDYGWNALIEFPLIMLDQKTQWLNPPSISAGCIIRDIAGVRILFSHFAIFEGEEDDSRYLLEKAYLRELFTSYQCDINIHGHTHDRHIESAQCYSACAEQTHFTPIMISQFLSDHGINQNRQRA